MRNVIKKKSERVLAAVMAALLVIPLLNLNGAITVEAQEDIKSVKTITAFAELDSAIREQQLQTGAPETEIVLPDKLAVTAGTASDNKQDNAEDEGDFITEAVTLEGIQWSIDPDEAKSAKATFDSGADIAGSVFTYIPALPEGYALGEGVTIPEIQVLVGESSIAAYALNETSYTYDMSTGSVKIEEGSTVNTLKVTSEMTTTSPGTVQDDIPKGTMLTITGTDAANDYNVVIDRAKDVNLTLNGVSLTSTSAGSSPVMLQAGAEAALNLEGENTLDASSIPSNDNTKGKGAGLTVPEGTKITIAGNGSLMAKASPDGAGIGGGNKGAGGTINITGGTVKATGSRSGAGIGGGKDGAGGEISISGGTIEATGDSWGAGIGGGSKGAGGTINIDGGTIEATGDSWGAGIGGGSEGAGGTINITGGTIEATGAFQGAGIGGGSEEAGGTINITGGMIEATGGHGAGIGGGSEGAGGTINITGGMIEAAGSFGAGIGGGIKGSGGEISISGGTIEATGSLGAGIGGGKDGKSGTFTTTDTSSSLGNAFIRASSIQDETYLSDSSNTQGVIFSGKVGTVYGSVTLRGDVVIKADETLTIGTDASLSIGSGINLTNSGTITNDGTLTNEGELYLAPEGIITIGNAGNLTGDGSFTAALKSEDITIRNEDAIICTGSQIMPEYEIKESRRIGTKDVKILSDGYTVSYGENINPGEGSIFFTNTSDKSIIVEKTFTIRETEFDMSEGSVKIEEGTTEGTLKVTYGIQAGNPQDKVLDNILKSIVITLTGAEDTKGYHVLIDGATGVKLMLDNISLKAMGGSSTPPLALQNGAEAVITLSGENILNASDGTNLSGVYIPQGTSAELSGSGRLTAIGGGSGAGIGGSEESDGSLMISGGIIRASSISNDNYVTADGTQGIIFIDKKGKVYGSPIISDDMEIDKDEKLTIPEGAKLTIAESVQFTNKGTIVVKYGGDLVINGTLTGEGEIIRENEIVNGEGYSLNRVTGVLTVSKNGAATAWRDDPDIKKAQVKEVVAEEGVTAIAERAFEDCFNLEKVTLPASLTSIGSSSFAGCSKLKEIIMKAPEPPSLGENPFQGLPETYRIVVSCGSTEQYQRGFGELSSHIVGAAHTEGEWTTENGKRVKRCSVCREIIAEEAIPASKEGEQGSAQVRYTSPKTGDESNLFGLLIMFLISGGACGGILVARSRRGRI